MFKRGVIDIFIIVFSLILPWWLTLFLACVLLFKFENYYEIIIIGFFLDVLYGIREYSFLFAPHWYALGALLLFITAQSFKQRLKYYA